MASAEQVRHEVQRPDLVQSRRSRQGLTDASGKRRLVRATASLTAGGVLSHPPLDALLPREQAKSAFLAH
jgi:hypothetical protein